MKRSIAIAGGVLAAGLLAAGGTTAYALSSPSPTPSADPTAGSDSGRPAKPPFGDMGQPLRGETVTRDPSTGKVTTHIWQMGQVTAVSEGSVTVKSADGTSWTWALTKDTRAIREGTLGSVSSGIKSGDQVAVRGELSGDTRQARLVLDSEHFGDFGGRRGFGLHKKMDRWMGKGPWPEAGPPS